MVPGLDQQLLLSSCPLMTQNQEMGAQEKAYPAGPLMPNQSTSLADPGLANMNGLNIGSIRTHDHIYDGSGAQKAAYPAGPLVPSTSGLDIENVFNASPLQGELYQQHHIDHTYDGSRAMEAAWPATDLSESDSQNSLVRPDFTNRLLTNLLQEDEIQKYLLDPVPSGDMLPSGELGEDIDKLFPDLEIDITPPGLMEVMIGFDNLPDSDSSPLFEDNLTTSESELNRMPIVAPVKKHRTDESTSTKIVADRRPALPEIDITPPGLMEAMIGYGNLLDPDSSPLYKDRLTTLESKLNMPIVAPVKNHRTDESTSTTIVADCRPALPADSSFPKVISTVPRVQPIGRKKIDMAAQRYVTTSDYSDISEDSDSIDVETVEGEASPVESSPLRLNPVYFNSREKEPKVSSLPQIKNEVDNKKKSRSNKENNVSSAILTAPVEPTPPSVTFTTQSTAEELEDRAKQLNNKLDEPSETARQPTASARKLSNTGSSNPLKTVRRQPTASNKSKTTNPIILLEPPEIDPALKKGRRSRNYKNKNNNNINEPSKKKTPQRRKRKVSDKTKPSIVKSSPPSSIPSIRPQEESTSRSCQTPSQSIPKAPSSIDSSRTTSPSTPATSFSPKLRLSDIPGFLSIESPESTRIPASKPKRPDRRRDRGPDRTSIRSANISTVNGDKQTILVLDNVTGNGPVKNVGTVKIITSAKPVVPVKTDTVSRRSIAHDHSYHSPSKQPVVNRVDNLTANISHSHTPQRTKTIVAAPLAQPLVNQLDNLTTTTATVSHSSTPQRTRKLVASTSTQSVERGPTVYTLNEFNTKYKTDLKIDELIVNNASGVRKKKLSLGDYLKRKKTVPQIDTKPPQAAKVSKVQREAGRSLQEMLSNILTTKQQESAVQVPNRVVLPSILPVQKVDQMRVRTIKPLPNFITVETCNKATNTDTKLDDRLIAALHQSSEPQKLIANTNTLFNELLANSIETAKSPVVASPNDNFEPPTIRHLDKEEVSRIETRSVEVQTDVHFGTSNVFSSSSSVRSPSPTLSHHSPQRNHTASNSSLGDSRSSYTLSSDIIRSGSDIDRCSPNSNPSSAHSNRSKNSPYIAVKRKREYEGQGGASNGRKVMFLGGLIKYETENELRIRFSEYKPSKIKICRRRNMSGKYAFLTFESQTICIRAIEAAIAFGNIAYEVGFGGRREFCDHFYFDYDDENSSVESISQRTRRISFTDELNDYAKLRKLNEKKT